jgi:hypothetical protein
MCVCKARGLRHGGDGCNAGGTTGAAGMARAAMVRKWRRGGAREGTGTDGQRRRGRTRAAGSGAGASGGGARAAVQCVDASGRGRGNAAAHGRRAAAAHGRRAAAACGRRATAAHGRHEGEGSSGNESASKWVVSRQERNMTCGPGRNSYRRLIRRLGFEHRLIASV